MPRLYQDHRAHSGLCLRLGKPTTIAYYGVNFVLTMQANMDPKFEGDRDSGLSLRMDSAHACFLKDEPRDSP